MAYNYFSMNQPVRPDYKPAYDPKTMGITDWADKSLGNINIDPSGYDRFKGEALRSGPSPWARMATAQQDMEAKNARDRGARAVAGQGATARTQLAMRGGLTGGAAERLAMEGQNNYMNMGQQIDQAHAGNVMQVGINDEQNRIQQLGMLPGMAQSMAGFNLDKMKLGGQARQFDTGNQIHEGDKLNEFNMNNYNEQMHAWGANQSADAVAHSGKKSG